MVFSLSWVLLLAPLSAQVVINPSSRIVTASAQSYNVAVTTESAWTVTDNREWISYSPDSGTGNGTVSVSVLQNPAQTSRTGTVTIGGQTHTVTQLGATPFVSIDPSSKAAGPEAQSYDIAVQSNTTWSVSDNREWISFSPPSGEGNGTVTVTLEANASEAQRSGTVSIGGQNHGVTQDGVVLFVTISPLQKSATAAAQNYEISVSSNTSWSVGEELEWASADPLEGSGNGTVTITLLENTTLDGRSGTITIGTESHSLTQAGAAPYVQIDPLEKDVETAETTYDITVTSNTNWTVTESLEWVSAAPTEGNGNATVTVTVSENSSLDSRGGQIDIGGQLHLVTQAGVMPLVEIDPLAITVDPQLQTYDITVTSNTDWTVVENTAWFSASPVEGTGNGTVTVTVAENTTIVERTGTITIGSNVHSLTQQGVPVYTTIDPQTNQVDHTEHRYSISVLSNTTWEVFKDESWLLATPPSGSGNGIVTVIVPVNPTTEDRNAILTIGDQVHNLTQTGAPEPPTIWDEYERDDDGWFQSSWYGWLLDVELAPIFAHVFHGWQFFVGLEDDLYIWDYSMACWFWTSLDTYPWLFKYGENSGWYFYYVGGVAEERWFYRHSDRGFVRSVDINEPIKRAPTYSLISKGTFTMGSPVGEAGRSSSEIQHAVTLTRDFYMQQTEVTNAQMVDVMNFARALNWVSFSPAAVTNTQGNVQVLLDLASPDSQISLVDGSLVVDPGKNDHPCPEVSWYGAMAYCLYLSLQEGLTAAIDLSDWSTNLDANGYRLPSEAEWEYACRAGTTTAYNLGPTTADLALGAWYNTLFGESQPVALLQPNDWDLYDMHGNLFEWTIDGLRNYGAAATDPVGPLMGPDRAIRGGSFYTAASGCRSASRFASPVATTFDFIGFRPVRTIPPEQGE